MTMIRNEARRKGLRMAAHVAAISGALAAAAAASQAAETKTPSVQDGSNMTGGANDGAMDPADRLSGLVRVSRGGGCGCAPCWGPPAPPAMRDDLFDAFDAAAEEVAS